MTHAVAVITDTLQAFAARGTAAISAR